MKRYLLIICLSFSTTILTSCGAIIMGIGYTVSDMKMAKDDKISNKYGYLEITNKIDSTTFSNYLIKKKKNIIDSTNTLKGEWIDSACAIKFKFKRKILCCQLTRDSTLLITNIFINEQFYRGDTINRKYHKVIFNETTYYDNKIDKWSYTSRGSIGYFNGIKNNSAFRIKKKLYRKVNRLTKRAKNRIEFENKLKR